MPTDVDKTKFINPTKGSTYFVQPFGPFNKFIQNFSNLYLESGAVEIRYTNYTKIDSYFPETLHTNKDWCPIVGYLRISFTVDEIANDCDKKRASSVGGGNGVKATDGKKGSTKSVSIGCLEPKKEISCSDPNGMGNITAYTHQISSRADISPPFLPIAPSAGQQLSVNDAYLVWQEAFRKSLNLQSYGKKIKRATPNTFKVPAGKEVCDCDIVKKKTMIKKELPANSFCGKAKLFVQAIYGAKDVLAFGKGDFPDRMYFYKGLEGKEEYPKDAPYANRIASLDKGMTKLLTDRQGNYYLAQIRGSVILNLLQPSKEGRLLQKWLATKQGLDKKTKAAYEAYILASCSPTKNVNTNTSLEAFSFGSDLGDYGWKTNWNGDEMSIAVIDWGTPNKSALFTASIFIDISGALEAEKVRKEDSLKQQWEASKAKKTMTAAQLKALTPSVKFQYACTEPLIEETIDEKGTTKLCVVGDIDEGAWWWVIVNSENSTPEQLKTFQKEADEKNHIDGGLPHSKEFYTELAGCIYVSESKSESGEFKFRYRNDRIFTWDKKYNVYNLELPYSVVDHIEGISGGGPVYCFYDKNDSLQVINYSCQVSVPDSEDNQKADDGASTGGCGDRQIVWHIESKGMCGLGSFSSSTASVKADTNGSYSYYKLEYSVQGCGGSFQEGPFPPYQHPGPCNIAYCGKWKVESHHEGTTSTKLESFSGEHNARVALVIPKSESEAVFLAQGDFYGGSSLSESSSGGGCVCRQTWTAFKDATYAPDCWSKPRCCNGFCGKDEPSPPPCCKPKEPLCAGFLATDEGGAAHPLTFLGWGNSSIISRRGPTGSCAGEVPKDVCTGISNCESYQSSKSENRNDIRKTGVVHIVTKSETKVVCSTSPFINEWISDGQFLGWIDPNYPWVVSGVDIKQSALGAWWCVSPDVAYSNDYPFDKKGLYFIGAS